MKLPSNKILNLLDLSGRRILITGGLGNLGIVMADTLSELGADLILIDRHDDEEAKHKIELLDEINDNKIDYYQCDLESHEAREIIIKEIINNYKNLNCIINNAAFIGSSDLTGWNGELNRQSVETWRRAIELNLTAPFHISKSLAGLLSVSVNASIINITSIYGQYGPDWQLYERTNMSNPAAYGASKAGLDQLTRWLSTTLAPSVRVNSISPGGIFRNQPSEFHARYCKKVPLGRMATEEDFRGIIAFLASGMSSYITGQTINVDGGFGVW